MREVMGRFLTTKKTLAALTGVVALLAASPARANLVTNGSFESGAYPGGVFATLPGGSTAINGWTVIGHSVDWINTYWQPSDGAFSLDLDGLGQGGVTQTVATTIGQTYKVTFDLAGNVDNLPTIKTIDVFAGSSLQSFTFDITGHTHGSMGWQTEQFYFTADSTSTALSFASADPGFYGAALDNVSVDAVPEPGTLALLGGGLVALARRRRKS